MCVHTVDKYVCACAVDTGCVRAHMCACVLILRAGAETPVFAPAAFPHQYLYCGVGSRGKGRGPSSVQLRVLNEGSSVAPSAEDICRCLELSQPGPWEGGGLPTMGLGTALKRLPKLDPLQEVLPGPDSAPLGYSRRCLSGDGGTGGSQGSCPLQLLAPGSSCPLRGSEWYCWSGWLVGLCLITLAL